MHDYVAALYIRDRLQRGLESSGYNAKALPTVEIGDELLRAFTVPDDQWVLRKVVCDVPQGPWWWRRIPESGPVASDLLFLDEAGSDDVTLPASGQAGE